MRSFSSLEAVALAGDLAEELQGSIAIYREEPHSECAEPSACLGRPLGKLYLALRGIVVARAIGPGRPFDFLIAMRLSFPTALLSVCLALVSISCSRVPAAEGVVHLDPKLEDGSSSAERLALTRTVLAEWKIEDTETDLGPWSLRNYMSVKARDGRPGIMVGDREVAPGVFPRVLLVWEGELLARDVNRLELDLLKYHRGGVRVSWLRDDDPPELAEDGHSLQLTIDESTEQLSRGFSVGTHAEWRGTIRRIVFTLATEGPQRFELSGMRFLNVGFSMGPDPLRAEDGFLWGMDPSGPSLDPLQRDEDAERRQRGASDGGLVAQGGAMRRAWPTDWNVPLYDACTIPRGGFLTVDTSIPGVLSAYEGELHFAVDVRLPQGKWIEVASRVLRPTWEEDPTEWVPLLADLSRFEGKECQLRFRNFASDRPIPPLHPSEDDDEEDEREPFERRRDYYQRDPRNIGLGGELHRTRAYWGSPIILGEMSKKRPPNIVLVTVDTLRADRVGPLGDSEGDSKGCTPFLAELAGVGVRFDEAWSPTNSTSPAHASILTGLDVHDHGVIDNFSMLAPEASSLAERLRERGYETAAAVSVPHLQAGRSGLGQGFDRFQLCAPLAPVNGGITLSSVQAWVEEWVAVGERPLFLWIHFFDPHTPYRSPDVWQEEWAEISGCPIPPEQVAPLADGTPGARDFPVSHYTQKGQFLWEVTNVEWPMWQYDAGVGYADLLIREVHAALRDEGLWEETAMFVTADHGESLGEHDRYFHHTSLFSETTKVPLFMVLPRSIPGAKKLRDVQVEARVSTLDIAATIEKLAELPRTARGQDLNELASLAKRGRAAGESRRVFIAHSHLAQFACVDDDWYFVWTPEDKDYVQLGPRFLVRAGTGQLFDRKADPGQERDVAADHPEVVKRLRSEILAWRAMASGVSGLRRLVDDAEREELERLGYTEGSEED